MAKRKINAAVEYVSLAADEADVLPADPAYERFVARMLEQLNLGRSFEGLFESVYTELRGIVPYNRIAVAMLEGRPPRLRLISCRSDGEVTLKVGYGARLAGSTLGPLISTGRSRIINDLEAYYRDKPQSASTRLILAEGMRANLTLPLIAEGEPIGVVFFSSREKFAYRREHALLLRRLAGHIAIGLEKVRWIEDLKLKNVQLAEANQTKDRFLELLRDEVRVQTEQLRVSEQRYRSLVRLGRLVTSSLDVREVFECAALELHKVIGCDLVNLRVSPGNGESEATELAIRFDPTGARHWVAGGDASAGGERLAVGEEVAEAGAVDRASPGEFARWTSQPLVSRGRPLGVLGLACRDAEAPPWDEGLIAEIAAQLSVAVDNASAYGKIDRLKRRLEQQNVYLREEIRTDHNFGDIIGGSRAMQQVRRAIRQVAATDSTVLIMGETGTGKELIARAIHDESRRRERLMVKVNCAALAPSLITSELFGHEPGAFTGATSQRIGRFELADGGTIFLDEISEMPAEAQAMLLRVLQERVFERVGGSEPIQVDTRLVAATNRDLKAYADEGHFRGDLYYRLHVFPIHVPPLRERIEDIPTLLDHFIGRFSERMNKQIRGVSARTMDLLLAYHWPGNVRELENVIERATIVSGSEVLEIDATWLTDRERAEPPSVADRRPRGDAVRPLAEVQRRAIVRALDACDGQVYGRRGAAALLGVKPTTLYGKMKKLGIELRRRCVSE